MPAQHLDVIAERHARRGKRVVRALSATVLHGYTCRVGVGKGIRPDSRRGGNEWLEQVTREGTPGQYETPCRGTKSPRCAGVPGLHRPESRKEKPAFGRRARRLA